MTFSTEDVKMVLSTISGYLIVLAVLLVVAIAVAVTVRKMDKLEMSDQMAGAVCMAAGCSSVCKHNLFRCLWRYLECSSG